MAMPFDRQSATSSPSGVLCTVAMANFHSEGTGVMTEMASVVWRVDPVSTPQPWRYFSTCGLGRLFLSSGKIKLNANRRRLDAWLIYKCTVCEKTWNLPFVGRAVIAQISEADLEAKHRNDPAQVRGRGFDLVAVGRCWGQRHPSRLNHNENLRRRTTGNLVGPEVFDRPKEPLEQRLDRLLAGELGISESELQSMIEAGGLRLDSASCSALRKPLNNSFTMRLIASSLNEGQLAMIARSVTTG